MKLPNADEAIVPERKITHYLLDDNHPLGGPKSAFFKRFGFSADQPVVLAAALSAHASAHNVAFSRTTTRGRIYEISGILEAPDGRMPVVRTVWIIRADETVPCFVTAMPD
jgi:hypothetical protein